MISQELGLKCLLEEIYKPNKQRGYQKDIHLTIHDASIEKRIDAEECDGEENSVDIFCRSREEVPSCHQESKCQHNDQSKMHKVREDFAEKTPEIIHTTGQSIKIPHTTIRGKLHWDMIIETKYVAGADKERIKYYEEKKYTIYGDDFFHKRGCLYDTYFRENTTLHNPGIDDALIPGLCIKKYLHSQK